MSHLLHLDTSARHRSVSRALSDEFASAWRRGDPDAGYAYRDLAATPVPPIGQGWTEICDAVLAAGITDPRAYRAVVETPAQHEAWAIVEPLLAELLDADVVVIGVPMYNFSVPAALKAWIDQVTFPRMSLAGRSVVITGARGGAYGPGTPRAPYDHHESYLRDFMLGHFGLDDVTFVHTELVNSLVDPGLAHLREAHHDSAVRAHDRVAAAVSDLRARRAV